MALCLPPEGQLHQTPKAIWPKVDPRMRAAPGAAHQAPFTSIYYVAIRRISNLKHTVLAAAVVILQASESVQQTSESLAQSRAIHLAANAIITLLEGLLLLLLPACRCALAPSRVRSPVEGIVFNVAALKAAVTARNTASKSDGAG